MQLNRKQAFFAVALVLLVGGFLEISLGLLTLVSPRVDELLTSPWTANSIPSRVPDERLGHRPNPAHRGHDRKGFRNPEVPAKSHIVALGDSQTYGTGVAREEAWPKHLESMIGKTVYSLAFGGYGPAHSLMLWDEAVALQPKIVIEAFYAGNDLFDSFNLVYNRGQLPDLKISDLQLQESIREMEQSEPIERRVSHMSAMGATNVVGESTARGILSQHSKIYGLLQKTRYEFKRFLHTCNSGTQDKWEIAKAIAEARPNYYQIFSNEQFKTVFTSEYRLSALDLEDPRIVEGLRISFRAMQRMYELAATRNIRFVVILIPTKETVFRRLWQNPSIRYRHLTENEERFWRTTKDFLEQNGIEYLDALPMLREQLETGIQPYQVSHDGHPNKYGHRAIAKLAAAYLEPPKTSQAQAKQDAAADADKPCR
jgi:GDSL-like Lipase/Acylhydrolase family